MDTQSNRLETTMKQTETGAHENAAAEVIRLRTEIEDARDGLGYYVSELDRRRHAALDLKLQLKKHKALGIGVSLVTVGAVAGAVALAVRSRRNGAQGQPWSPWRIAPSVGEKSRLFGRFLLGTAVPAALKAARGVVERAASQRPRMV